MGVYHGTNQNTFLSRLNMAAACSAVLNAHGDLFVDFVDFPIRNAKVMYQVIVRIICAYLRQ